MGQSVRGNCAESRRVARARLQRARRSLLRVERDAPERAKLRDHKPRQPGGGGGGGEVEVMAVLWCGSKSAHGDDFEVCSSKTLRTRIRRSRRVRAATAAGPSRTARSTKWTYRTCDIVCSRGGEEMEVSGGGGRSVKECWCVVVAVAARHLHALHLPSDVLVGPPLRPQLQRLLGGLTRARVHQP